jgi:hypothetical protein
MSVIKNRYSRGKIEKKINDIYYFSRDEIKFITLEKYNQISGLNYKKIEELIKNPPKFSEELEIRYKLTNSYFDLSAIIVLEELDNRKYEIYIESKIYEDVQDKLLW